MNGFRSRQSMSRVVLLLMLLPLLVYRCTGHEQIAGTYQAVATGPQGDLSATLELNPDGKGLWSIETDNAPFRWDHNGNNIRLHTPSGGVIVGTIDAADIRIEIPGAGMITFRRTK